MGVNILYTGQYPPQDTSLEVSLPCSLLSSLNPSPALFLPPAFNASPRPFLARSLPQPSLPQPSLPPLIISACLASSLPLSHPPSLSLPPSPCSLPHHPLAPSLPPTSLSPPLHPSYSSPTFPPPSLAPSLPSSFLPRALPAPSLPATSRRSTQCTPSMCVWHAALYCIAPSQALYWDNGAFIATAGIVWARR